MKNKIVVTSAVIIVMFVGQVIVLSQSNNALGATSYIAKGDDSDEDNSGPSGRDSSGSSERENDSEDKEDENKNKEEVRVESRGKETRVELRQKTEGDKIRIKQEIRSAGGRVKFEIKNGETKVRVETKTGQPQAEFTVESPATTSSEIAKIENPEEKFKLKIRTRGDRFEIRSGGASALTNFPLSLNPETQELSVTTPQGTTVLIKTLPQVAVQNILASNIMDRVLGQNIVEPDEEDVDEEEEVEEEGIPEVKVEGFVESLSASQITVSGVTFTLTSATKFEGVIIDGSGVEVKGASQNGTLIARKVELEDEVEPKVKIQGGVVESVTDSAIVVSGITFARSPATRIEGQVAPGQLVQIKGALATGGALLANKVEIEIPGEGTILTEEQGTTVFKVKGQKDARFLSLFPVTFPVEATVSVETGRVLSVSRPFLLNIFGFLFRT